MLQAGEMEVKNPLFLDDPTPATPANLTQNQNQSSSNQAPPTTTPSADEKKAGENEKKAKK